MRDRCPPPASVPPPTAVESVTEYGERFPSGDVKVRDSTPLLEKVYPLARWLEDKRLDGARVLRREIIVVSDWTEA